MKNPAPAAQILPFQPTLWPALPVVLGQADYQDFAGRRRRLEQRLIASGGETSVVEQSRAPFAQQFPAATTTARQRQQRHSYRARCGADCSVKIIAG